MDLQAEINWIKSELDSVQDVSLLKKLKDLLNKAKVKRYEASLKPMTQDELIARARQSEEDLKAGRVKSLSQLREDSESW